MAEQVAEADPLAALWASHASRMQEIADQSFVETKDGTAKLLKALERDVHVKHAVIDETLAALGITDAPK